MRRVSRQLLQNKIDALNRRLNRPVEPWVTVDGRNVAQVGNLHFDHQLGGWRIEEMANDGGGIRTPFGNTRWSAADMADVIDAILGALQLQNPKGK